MKQKGSQIRTGNTADGDIKETARRGQIFPIRSGI